MTKLSLVIYEGEYGKDIENRIKEQLKFETAADIAGINSKISEYISDNAFFRKKNDGDGGLRFVGVFTVNTGEYRILVYALPKYLNGVEDSLINPERYMSNIRRVIDKTGHLFDYDISAAEFNPNNYNRKKNKITRYDMARWLVNDYESNGIFTVREKRNTRNRRGRIAWNRTILKTVPLIDEDEVLYSAPISTYVARNDKLLLSDIHRCVIKEALDELGAERANVAEPIYKEELLGHLESYASVIRSFQRLVFLERDILLLRYLEAWCLYESSYYLKPVGTVSFELVWEDVLRGVFGHPDLDGKLGFGSPRYQIGDRMYDLDGDSIPDVLNFWNDEMGNTKFTVIDGKYYLGEIKGKKVRNLPGYKDVAKQIDYFETLVKVYGLTSEYGKNIFMLPRWDKLCNAGFDCYIMSARFRYVGFACKPEKDSKLGGIIDKLKKVEDDEADKKTARKNSQEMVFIIQVEPDSLYREFLNGVSDTKGNADKIWKYIEQRFYKKNADCLCQSAGV